MSIPYELYDQLDAARAEVSLVAAVLGSLNSITLGNEEVMGLFLMMRRTQDAMNAIMSHLDDESQNAEEAHP